MQIGRLFGIVYLLLDKKKVTAGQLAEHFGVSTRTIHRDIEALSQAGIPIYASRGTGGGIQLTDSFILNKSVLTQQEKQSILALLNGMRAVKFEEADAALQKLSVLFGGERVDWIEINFSPWNPDDPIGSTFDVLRQGIFAQRVAAFDYSGTDGSTARRVVEPAKLIFRGRSWYLLGWCRLRRDFRYFKLLRMGQPILLDEVFERHIPPAHDDDQPFVLPSVLITAHITPELSYRVFDELAQNEIQKLEDGAFLVRFYMPDNEWLYDYLMTFGAGLYVVDPPYIRETLYKKLKAACAQYEI